MAKLTATLRFGVAFGVALAVAGCQATYRNHGYMPPQDVLDGIVVGVDTRASVEESVGSPTSAGVLGDTGYYYVRSRVRNFAYRAPEVVEREVLAISFDGAGTVSNIERYGLEDGRVVPLEQRVTESSVTDRTFLRQLLGNIGRIGAPAPAP